MSTPQEVQDRLRAITTNKNAENVVRKLRLRVEALDPSAAATLALAVSGLGSEMPRPQILFSFTTPYERAAMLVARLIRQIPTEAGRLELSNKVVETASPVEFAVLFVRWVRTSDDEPPEKHVLSKPNESIVRRRLLARLDRESKERNIVYEAKDPRLVLQTWAYYAPAKAGAHVRKWLREDGNFALALIEAYVGRVWGDKGSRIDDVEDEDIERMAQLVKPSLVLASLKRSGYLFPKPVYDERPGQTLHQRLTEQFTFLLKAREGRKEQAAEVIGTEG